MKRVFFLILSSILLLGFNTSFSQEPCKVLKPEIGEKYEGKCKKGLAQGKGIAEGKDKYIGRFKDGLPNGKGKYIWSTGEVYEGEWKDGKRDGEGTFSYKINGVDSVKYGIWQNDLFVKKIVPNPYKIIKTSSVARYSVSRMGDGNQVVFSIMQNGKASDAYSNPLFSPSSGTPMDLGRKQGFENIVFPFTCKMTFSMPNSLGTSTNNVEFEIEITEPGFWEIVITTN